MLTDQSANPAKHVAEVALVVVLLGLIQRFGRKWPRWLEKVFFYTIVVVGAGLILLLGFALTQGSPDPTP